MLNNFSGILMNFYEIGKRFLDRFSSGQFKSRLCERMRSNLRRLKVSGCQSDISWDCLVGINASSRLYMFIVSVLREKEVELGRRF